jgi:hypothetical protein
VTHPDPQRDGGKPDLKARLLAWAGRVTSKWPWLVPLAVLIAFALKHIAITKSVFTFAAMYVEFALRHGWLLGGLFLAQLALQEAGHFVVARRRGFSPGWPIFIPFVGAYVAIADGFRTQEDEVDIAAAGPA